MLFIRRKEMVRIANEIVEANKDALIKELNVPDVKTTVLAGWDIPGVSGRHTASYRGPFASMFGYDDTCTYVPEESSIAIWPEVMTYIWLTRNTRIRLLLTKKAFERRIVETLAHEFRHVYQFYHRVHLQDNNMTARIIKGYRDLAHEKDAFSWSKKYRVNTVGIGISDVIGGGFNMLIRMVDCIIDTAAEVISK